MATNKCSIELKNSHSLEDAMREFTRNHRMDLLAPKIGTTANVLRNKLNPDQEFHKLSLLEAINLAANTGDLSIIRASIQMLGFDCHEVGDISTTDRLISQVLNSASAAGNVTILYNEASADQVIDKEETACLIKATDDAIQKFQTLRTSLREGLVA